MDYAGPDAAHPALWRRSSLTVGELWHQVISLAAALQRKGIRSGDIVAVQLPNWHEYLIAFLANHAIGAVTTSISPIFRERDVARQLELSGAAVLIVPGQFGSFDFIGMARELVRDTASLRHIVVAGPARSDHEFYAWRDLMADGGSDDAARLRREITAGAHAPDMNALAVLNFSSGTTGEPKGVMHSAASVSACVPPTVERLGLGTADVVLVVPTLGHGAGILNGLFLPLMLPTKVVYLDRWDAALAIEVIERERVTYMPAMPTYLFDLARLPAIRPDAVQSWVTARVSGGAISRDVMAIHARFPRLRLCPGWGMSETLWATCGAPGDPLDKRNTTEGRPIGDWRLQIRDAALEQDLPAGESGEIVVKGGSLMLGYWRRESMTQASFTPDGWFKTGDIGRLDADGFLVLTGRSKELVIRGGENVPIVEIETLLMEHPQIRAVAVVGIPDPRLGEKVCAVVECRTDAAHPTLGEVSDYLIGRKLTKQFIPQFLLVVDELPRTAVGKVKKQAVRDDAVRRLNLA